ncbi:hypothetical protein BJ322DRAFT_828555 [Thelephora terrestris]|uniref:Uncharacterized protein n=1 Tax=Thelephora terrestris TaxID=56493 RepID=A0A9P6HEM4_9AGAM|nr:hypothetical protein BJ322DRAFT_828555 [Thelephora terrestris]
MSSMRFSRGSLPGEFCVVFLRLYGQPLGLTCPPSQEEVMGMEWELLIPKLGDPEKLALVKENVGLISSGSSSHCADTLKLGLKKAFELKKEKRERPVKLRCSNSNCARHQDHPPYSSTAMNSPFCQHCFYSWGNYYLQCVSCGWDRTGSYSSCQGCGRRFI